MGRQLWPLLSHERRAAGGDIRPQYVQPPPWGIAAVLVWVRRLGRGQRWVWAKLVINAARIRLRDRQRLAPRLQ